MVVRTTPARVSHPQHIHFIRSRLITAADDAVTISVGTIPAQSIIIHALSGLSVHVAFDGTTLSDIGFAATPGVVADPNFYQTAAVTTAIGWVPLDEAVTGLVTIDTPITVTLTGGTVTVGSATAIVGYVPVT